MLNLASAYNPGPRMLLASENHVVASNLKWLGMTSCSSAFSTLEKGGQWHRALSLLDQIRTFAAVPAGNTPPRMIAMLGEFKHVSRHLRSSSVLMDSEFASTEFEQLLNQEIGARAGQQSEEQIKKAEDRNGQPKPEATKVTETSADGYETENASSQDPAEDPWKFLEEILQDTLGREMELPGKRSGLDTGPEPELPIMTGMVALCLPVELRGDDGLFKGTFVDCAFGRGTQSRIILRYLGMESRLFAFDMEKYAVSLGEQLEKDDARFRMLRQPFADIEDVLAGEKLNGVLINLEPHRQLDDPERLLNIMNGGVLDLRANPDGGMSASRWLSTASREEIAWVIYNHNSRVDKLLADRIAQAIDDERQTYGPIEFARHLSLVVRMASRDQYSGRHGAAQLTFQALKSFLNHESRQLEQGLRSVFKLLEYGGLCTVATYKKMETEVVHKLVREHEEPDPKWLNLVSPERMGELYPLLLTEKDYAIEEVGHLVDAEFFQAYKRRYGPDAFLHILRKVRRNAPAIETVASAMRPMAERFQEPERPAFQGETAL